MALVCSSLSCISTGFSGAQLKMGNQQTTTNVPLSRQRCWKTLLFPFSDCRGSQPVVTARWFADINFCLSTFLPEQSYSISDWYSANGLFCPCVFTSSACSHSSHHPFPLQISSVLQTGCHGEGKKRKSQEHTSRKMVPRGEMNKETDEERAAQPQLDSDWCAFAQCSSRKQRENSSRATGRCVWTLTLGRWNCSWLESPVAKAFHSSRLLCRRCRCLTPANCQVYIPPKSRCLSWGCPHVNSVFIVSILRRKGLINTVDTVWRVFNQQTAGCDPGTPS